MGQIVWMVRAGEKGYLAEDFISKKVIAIGWEEIGDLTNIKSQQELKELLRKIYSDTTDGWINTSASQIYKFRREISKGSRILTYDPISREYWIGEVTSDYKFAPELIDYPNIREVNWESKILRDSLSTTAKNSLGSTLTIFRIPDEVVVEILNGKASGKNQVPQAVNDESQSLDQIKEDIEAKAAEFIQDKLAKLSWDDMQELVAGILRGMGYKTLVSAKGSDRGKDIMASPDGLGLEDPRIKVEVKHRKGQMGTSEIRSFLGGLRPGERGIYVSTGGFTKEARYEGERANNPLTLIDSELLVDLIVQYYSNFDPDTRALIPLKKIYWPIEI